MKIIYEDRHMLVCEKDAGVPVQTASVRVKDLTDEGLFLFGGEKRVSKFKRIKSDLPDLDFCNAGSGQFYSFVPVEAKVAIDDIISSGKIFATAGWDLLKGFHKPTTNWIPAGAVYKTNINNICKEI